MNIQRYRTSRRMSQVTVHGGVAYLSGQVGSDPDAGVREQTQQTLTKIDELLTLVGSNRGQLLGATVWLTDIATFDEMNSVWESWIPDGAAPARTTVEARLAHAHWKIEIMAWAAISENVG